MIFDLYDTLIEISMRAFLFENVQLITRLVIKSSFGIIISRPLNVSMSAYLALICLTVPAIPSGSSMRSPALIDFSINRMNPLIKFAAIFWIANPSPIPIAPPNTASAVILIPSILRMMSRPIV